MFDASGERAKMKTAQSQESTKEVQSTSKDVSCAQCHGKINGGDLGALPGKTKLYAFESLRDSYQLLSLSSAS